MTQRKIATALYLTPEQHDGLKKLSAHTKVPMASYLRDAVDVVLQQHAAELAAVDLGGSFTTTEAPATEAARQ